MPTLPSLDNFSPDKWIEEMKALSDNVVEEASRILDTRTTPERAAPALQQVFDRYNDVDIGLASGADGSATACSLEVRAQGDMLIVWAYPSEDYQSLVYTAGDYWWFDHTGTKDGSRDRHEIHCTVTRRIVEMLPWANEDDLVEIAAIEMSSRAG